MTIDYRRTFEKLVDQIKTEERWAKEQYDGDYKKAEKELSDRTESLATYGALKYDRGMVFAYESIRRLAEQLEDEVDEEDE